jgi:hypothetical protein
VIAAVGSRHDVKNELALLGEEVEITCGRHFPEDVADLSHVIEWSGQEAALTRCGFLLGRA